MIELTMSQIVKNPSVLREAIQHGDVRLIWKEQKPNGKVIESAIVRKEAVK